MRRCGKFSPMGEKHQGRRCHRPDGHDGEHEAVRGDGEEVLWPAAKKRIFKKAQPPGDVDVPLVAPDTDKGWGGYKKPVPWREGSQSARVLRYLLRGRPWSVTPQQAWEDQLDGEGQIQRLAAVIHQLRQHCYAIKTHFDKDKRKPARYELVKRGPCDREASGECLYWTPRLNDCVQWGMLNDVERKAYNRRVRPDDDPPCDDDGPDDTGQWGMEL